ncbi:hypothetical protein ACUXIC_000657, partial [Enterococcus lactis]
KKWQNNMLLHVMVLGKLRKHSGKQTVGTKIHLLIERFTFIQRKPKEVRH